MTKDKLIINFINEKTIKFIFFFFFKGNLNFFTFSYIHFLYFFKARIIYL